MPDAPGPQTQKVPKSRGCRTPTGLAEGRKGLDNNNKMSNMPEGRTYSNWLAYWLKVITLRTDKNVTSKERKLISIHLLTQKR